MKKSVANEIAKHLNEVAKNTTDETAFVVNVYGGLTEKDYYIELTPDYKRRTANIEDFQDYIKKSHLRGFYHIQEVADIERYHGVFSYITAVKATYNGKEYDICRVTIC
jgi:hypothetical protein